MKKIIALLFALILMLLVVLGLKTITGGSYLIFGGIIGVCIVITFIFLKSSKSMRKSKV